MALDRKSLVLLLGGGALAFLYLRKRDEEARAAQYQAQLAAATVDQRVEYGPGSVAGSDGSKIGTVAGGTGGMAIGTIFGGPVGGKIGGTIGSLLGSIFGGLFDQPPPDPVESILITAFPLTWDGRENRPPGETLYALDRFGYLHKLSAVALAQLGDRYRGGTSGQGSGWLGREVIAVSPYVYAVMPHAGGPDVDVREQVQERARPDTSAGIREVFGNEARFCLGDSYDVRGPWDGEEVAALPGTPAGWAGIAGTYDPTKTATPGEF